MYFMLDIVFFYIFPISVMICNQYWDGGICKSCPNGWSFYKQNCYFKSNSKLNFLSAVKDCSSKNANLLSINNIYDHKEFINRYRENDQEYWVF